MALEIKNYVSCSECKGVGYIGDKECSKCKGMGLVRKKSFPSKRNFKKTLL